MANLTGMKEIKKEIFQLMTEALNEIGDEVVQEVQDNLKSNRTADGQSQPIKKPSTKRAYAKKGWNQDDWLVRTGRSTELDKRVTSKEVTIRPKGYELLMEKFKTQAEAVFTLSSKFREDLVNKLKNKLSKELK